MKTNFPTIRELENAILFWMADNYGKCEYNKDAHTFLAIEFVQKPHYDSGGGLDCMDFEPVEHIISFLEAYKMWEGIMNFQEKVNKQFQEVPAPVCPFPKDYEEVELPF